MTLAVSDAQREVLNGGSVAMVTLIKHDIFSDYDSETIQSTFYWAFPFTVQYRYLDVNAVFAGRILSIEPIERSFDHIPTPDSIPARGAIEITFDNGERGGEYLFDRLTNINLIGSKMEIATLLVDRRFLDEARPDLTLGVEDHVVRFRGEVTSLGEMDDDSNVFSVIVESFEPAIDWPVAESDAVDPRDKGKRYPIIVGDAKRIPCIRRDVGAVAVLSEEMDTSTTSILVSDASDFPAAPFEVVIDAERIAVGSVSGDTLSSLSRGEQGTSITPHRRGSLVAELADTLLVVSGEPVADVTALRVVAPQTNDLIQINSSLYSVTLADTTVDSGRTLTVVRITAENLFTALKGADPPAVATQPEFADSGATVSTITKAFSAGTQRSESVFVERNASVSLASGDIDFSHAAGTDEQGEQYWNDADLGTLSDDVARFRITVQWSVTSPAGGLSKSLVMRLARDFLGVNDSFPVGSALGTTESGTYTTPWITPPEGTTVDDMSNGSTGFNQNNPHLSFALRNTPAESGTSGSITISGCEVEIERITSGSAIEQTSEVTLDKVGAQSGFGLEFFADAQGASAASASTFLDLSADSSNWNGDGGDVTFSDAGQGFQIDVASVAVSDTLIALNGDASNWINQFILGSASNDGTGVLFDGGSSGPGSDFSAYFSRALSSPIIFGDDGSITVDVFVTSAGLTALQTRYGHARIWVYDTEYTRSTSGTSGYKFDVANDLVGGSWVTLTLDLTTNIPIDPAAQFDYIVVDFRFDRDSLIGPGFSNAFCKFDNDFVISSKIPQVQADRSFTAKDLSESRDLSYDMEVASGDYSALADTAFRFSIFDGSNGIYWDVAKTKIQSGGATTSIVHFISTPTGTIGSGLSSFSAIDSCRINVFFSDKTAQTISFGTITQTDQQNVDHPIDVAQFVIEEFFGLTGAVDGDSFAEAKDRLPSVAFSGDLRRAGQTFGEIMAAIGYECRTNFLPREDQDKTRWIALTAKTDNTWDAPTVEIETAIGVRLNLRTLAEMATQYSALYDFRNDQQISDVNAYRGLIVSNETTNDLSGEGVPTSLITTAQARVGKRRARPLFFNFLPDETSAIEVFSYYVYQATKTNFRRIALSVPLRDGYDLQMGDLRSFTPRWEATAIDCRVVSVIIVPDEPRVGVVLEEVP